MAISGDKILIKGVFDKLVTRMVEKGGAIRGYDLIRSNKYYPFDTSRCENDLQITPWDPEAFKLSADELMAEHGVKVYFYTQFTEILKEGNKVVGGVIENRSGRQVILAKRVVDCTGAAAVAQMAGRRMLRASAQGLHDADVPGGKRQERRPVLQAECEGDPLWCGNFFPLIREGDFRVEMTRYIGSENSAEDYTKGTIECRRQCQEVLQYLKEHWIGFEDAYIIDTAPTLGSLAQPALVGEKKMTQEMILKREMPDDRIAITAYGIDLHSPEMGGQNFLYYLPPGEYYGVPFGVVVPKSPVENLLGRRKMRFHRAGRVQLRLLLRHFHGDRRSRRHGLRDQHPRGCECPRCGHRDAAAGSREKRRIARSGARSFGRKILCLPQA